MDSYIVVAIGVLGAIVGSFLNALLFRYKTGSSVLKGRSKCMRCGHTLSAIDLVPILSYVFLRGQCRYCGAGISWQYPLVECGAAVLAVATWVRTEDPFLFSVWFAIHLTLLFILVYDLRHKIIPTAALAVLVGLALLTLFVNETATTLDWIAGPVLALPLFFLSLVSAGRWMGWADAPLELGLGMVLGLSAGLTALMVAFWSGAFVGICLLLLGKGYRMKSEVPFAPFLIAGAWAVHFLHVDFFPLLPYLFV